VIKLSSCSNTVALCLAALISTALTAQEEKVRMAVRVFEPKDNSLAESVTSMLINELRQNRNYQLIDLGKTVYDISSNPPPKFDYLVSGTFVVSTLDKNTKHDAYTDRNGKRYPSRTTYSTDVNVILSVTVVESGTQKVVISASESGKSTQSWGEERPKEVPASKYLSAAEKPITTLAFNIMDEIHPLEPSVIQVRGKDLTIDMGREDGIMEKQRFAIIREGERLYNRNGDLVGVEKIEIAHITITRVEPRIAYAKIEKINNNPDTRKPYVINIGDLAKLQDRTMGRTAGEKLGGLVKDFLR